MFLKTYPSFSGKVLKVPAQIKAAPPRGERLDKTIQGGYTEHRKASRGIGVPQEVGRCRQTVRPDM